MVSAFAFVDFLAFFDFELAVFAAAGLSAVALAYLARYAFDTEWAFLGVLLFGAALGGIIYYYSLNAAVKAAGERIEEIIGALSRGEGPIESS